MWGIIIALCQLLAYINNIHKTTEPNEKYFCRNISFEDLIRTYDLGARAKIEKCFESLIIKPQNLLFVFCPYLKLKKGITHVVIV